jgi:2'-5' RNA ligase
MTSIRTFIALPVPEDVRSELALLQARLVESQAAVKWDTPDKFHITLKFLGDTDASRLPLIATDLQDSIGSLPAFDVTYEALGGFPNVDRPRVVWIGARQSKEILHLQEHVEQVCTSFGFAKEDRPFHAHITLGRVKGDRNLDSLTAKLKSITFKPLTARCAAIHIMRSEMKPTGSVYTLLDTIPLAP